MKGDMIALTGDPRVGKDTVADLLVSEFGYVKAAFADPLYLEIADAYGVTLYQLRSDEWKAHAQAQLTPSKSGNPDFIKVCQSQGLFADEALSSRRVLQLWSTEYRRAMYGEDYWVAQMIEHIRGMKGLNIVFSDLRFDVEACMGHWHVSRGMAKSFRVFKILRAGSVASAHSSDQGISKFLIDGVIRNNTTPGECFAELLALLNPEQEESQDNGQG